jgi:hypothetical protein
MGRLTCTRHAHEQQLRPPHKLADLTATHVALTATVATILGAAVHCLAALAAATHYLATLVTKTHTNLILHPTYERAVLDELTREHAASTQPSIVISEQRCSPRRHRSAGRRSIAQPRAQLLNGQARGHKNQRLGVHGRGSLPRRQPTRRDVLEMAVCRPARRYCSGRRRSYFIRRRLKRQLEPRPCTEGDAELFEVCRDQVVERVHARLV